MKYNLPCAVVQDLLPNYTEALTSEETNEAIQEHLCTCKECSRIYEAMKETPSLPTVPEQKEIDFLKKTRNHTRRSILSICIGALCILLSVLLADQFVIGRTIHHVQINSVDFTDENTIWLNGNCDGNEGFKNLQVIEEDGKLQIAFQGTRKSGIYSNDIYEEYKSANPITEIRIEDQIVWKDGIAISSSTNDVFQTRHAYAGSMPENNETANALNMRNVLPGYTNELETEKEPYVWKLISRTDLSDQSKEALELNMRHHAYAILASIDNLSAVSYEYVYQGNENTLTVTNEEADEFAGEDIKEVGKDIVKLEKLMRKAGLTASQDVMINYEVKFKVINDAEALQSIGGSCYKGDEIISSFNGMNANGTLIPVGEEYECSAVFEYEFTNGNKSGEEMSVQLDVMDQNGEVHTVEPKLKKSELMQHSSTFSLTKENGTYTLTKK